MSKMIGSSRNDLPWQDKPKGYQQPVWRYDANPIIGRYETSITSPAETREHPAGMMPA
jgi:hypothetical protein